MGTRRNACRDGCAIRVQRRPYLCGQIGLNIVARSIRVDNDERRSRNPNQLDAAEPLVILPLTDAALGVEPYALSFVI